MVGKGSRVSALVHALLVYCSTSREGLKQPGKVTAGLVSSKAAAATGTDPAPQHPEEE